MQPGARFTKISYSARKGRVAINYEVPGDEDPDTYTMSTRAEPHPDFIAALGDLAPDVISICEQSCDEEDIEVRGVSFSYPQDVMGVTITGLRALESSNSPLILNTPFKLSEPMGEDEGDEKQLLAPWTVGRLRDLIVEARAFVDRTKRGQADLFEPAEQESGELVGVGVD